MPAEKRHKRYRMKQFANVVKEIKSVLAGITLFFILMDSLIVFLAVYLILTVIDLYPAAALIPAFFYFAYSLYQETRMNKIRIVEKFYPKLNEKLRTAADYVNVENEVVDDLHREVIAEMKDVAAASFFNRKETFEKVAIIVALCFVVIGITFFGINFAAFQGKLKGLLGDLGGGDGEADDQEGEIAQTIGGGAAYKDIYGEKTLAKLGDKEIEVQMRTSSYEFTIREAGELGETEEFREQFPTDVTSVESRNYNEVIPGEKDKQELIKRYFAKLTGS